MADDQYFPPEIIYEILSRMPIKSLARFRCVSKSWFEYIDDSYFETIHRLKEEVTPILFQQLIHPNKHYCMISFLRAIQGTSIIVKKDPVLQLHEYSSNPKDLVLGSCNGLTLVCYKKDLSYATFLALINPLTKQRYNLPPIKIRSGNRFFYPADQAAGIGFDDSTNSLKTVCVVLKQFVSQDHMINVEPCTLVHYSGGSGSWREIADVPAYPTRGPGVFAHGRLYWLVDSHWWTLEEGTKVVSFDVKREKFGLLNPPKRQGGYWIDEQLVDLNGELGFAYIDDKRIELWMILLKEGDDQGRWVWYCGFDLYLPPYNFTSVVVSGFWNNDGDILFTSNHGKQLFVYTLKTKDLCQLHLLLDDHQGTTADYIDAHIRVYPNNLSSIRTITAYYSLKNNNSIRTRRRKIKTD